MAVKLMKPALLGSALAAVILVGAVFFYVQQRKPASLSEHNRTTLETIRAVEALHASLTPDSGPVLPEIGPPNLEDVTATALPSKRTGPLYLHKLPATARPHHGPPQPALPEAPGEAS